MTHELSLRPPGDRPSVPSQPWDAQFCSEGDFGGVQHVHAQCSTLGSEIGPSSWRIPLKHSPSLLGCTCILVMPNMRNKVPAWDVLSCSCLNLELIFYHQPQEHHLMLLRELTFFLLTALLLSALAGNSCNCNLWQL